jgi:hypothetical protein
MLVIDAANVRAADGRGLHAQQNFTMPGVGTGTVRISTVESPGRNAASLSAFIVQFHALSIWHSFEHAKLPFCAAHSHGGVISP